MIETLRELMMLYPLTSAAIIVIVVGLGGVLLSEYRDKKNKK